LHGEALSYASPRSCGVWQHAFITLLLLIEKKMV
jgi:hypothetical protein